jgi:hypothetical protein
MGGRYSQCKACKSLHDMEQRRQLASPPSLAAKTCDDNGDEEEENERIQRHPTSAVSHQSRPLGRVESSQEASRLNRARRDEEAKDPPTSKFCSICLQDKPLTEYFKNATKMFGHYSQCKACNSALRWKAKGTSSNKPKDEDPNNAAMIPRRTERSFDASRRNLARSHFLLHIYTHTHTH